MIALVILLLILGASGFGIWCAGEDDRRELKLRALRQQAERAIEDEAARAKRAMNDAADQPWRNLVD